MIRRARILSVFLATSLPLCLSACADPMLQTKAWPPDLTKPIQGVPYFLPIGAIPITLTTKPSSGADTTGSQSADVQSASNTSATPKTDTSTQKDNTTGKPPSNPAPLLTLTMDSFTTNTSTKTPKPPYTLVITAGPANLVADTTQEYYLNFDMPPGVDSMLTLKVDGNGLLSNSSAESVDETAAEAAALTQTIAALAEGIFKPAEVKQIQPPQTSCDLPTVTRAANLVPLYDLVPKGKTVESVLPPAQLPALLPAPPPGDATPQSPAWTPGSNLEWTPGPDPTILVPNLIPNQAYWIDSKVSDNRRTGEQTIYVRVAAQSYSAPDRAPAPTNIYGGPLFRDWARWRLTLIAIPNYAAEMSCNVLPTIASTDVMLPNGGKVFTLDTSRTPLVDKAVSFTVSNGMINGYSVNRPSPLLAGLKLPLTVLQPILSLLFTAVTGGATKPTGSGLVSKPQSARVW